MIKKFKICFFILSILVLASFASAEFSNPSSTSVSNIQSTNPDFSNPIGFEFQNLISGPSGSLETGEEFLDMQLYIPPLGCKPLVVRSDLLEEQDVPVFCEIDALKINPGVNIQNIDRVVVSKVNNILGNASSNDYIRGVGFYPARAAIRSQTGSSGIPVDNKVGYVVIVLKKQPQERLMPESVNATLSAYINYGSSNSFGIGQSEFYLPVMEDNEFAINYKSYSFFNGIGYLRVEQLDDTSATISIYDTQLKRVWSNTIQKGKTSSDFYINSFSGGQSLRVSLKDITLPETKAKILINGQSFDVFKGEKFYNSECTLTSIESWGGETGKVTGNCHGKAFSLEKKYNQIRLLVNGARKEVSIREQVDVPGTDKTLHYYPLYLGNMPDANSFIILGHQRDNLLISDADLQRAMSDVSKNVNSISTKNAAEYKNKLLEIITYSNINYEVLFLQGFVKDVDLKFDSVLVANQAFSSEGELSTELRDYYKKTIDSYEDVFFKFGGELDTFTGATKESQQVFGAESLWKEYSLAEALKQKEDSTEILSRIENSYPNSFSEYGKTFNNVGGENNLLSNEGSSTYYSDKDLYVELVSIKDASIDSASADVYYNGDFYPNTRIGETIPSSDKSFSIQLTSLTDKNVYFNYSCTVVKGSTSSLITPSTLIVSEGQQVNTPNCNAQIKVSKIYYQKVAKVELTPHNGDKSRANNFTFSIGIEKRSEALKLLPAEANQKIKELNDLINEWKNITESLRDVIKAGNAACLATSALLNIKNLFLASDGEASARNYAMTRTGGWNDFCSSQVASKLSDSFDKCLSANKDAIDSEIEQVSTGMTDFNKDYADAQEKSKLSNKQGVVDNTAAFTTMATASINSWKTQAIAAVDNNGKSVTEIDGKSISKIISEINLGNGDLQQSEFKDLWMSIKTVQSEKDERQVSAKKIYSILSQVKQREDVRADLFNTSSLQALQSTPINSVKSGTPWTYTGKIWNNKYFSLNFTLPEGDKIVDGTKIAFAAPYMFVLNPASLRPSGVYRVDEKILPTKSILSKIEDDEERQKLLDEYRFEEVKNQNECKNCNVVKVYSNEPYKGMIQQMPFNKKEGWYIETRATTGSGNTKTYQDSGQINSYYLCNVGTNGQLEGMNVNDDTNCRRFDTYSGDVSYAFSGMDQTKSRQLVQDAQSAISSAQGQLAKNPTGPITINGMTLKVEATSGITGSKCTDFMSIDDCKLMFNVCDPFVCPSSRCDFGGEYPVDNVIQSGIVGSVALCLPNSILAGGDVVVPVCITGIAAGIEGWTAILESYRDCLNTSITTNTSVGICDEIQSVFVCDFFWKQVGPFASALAKNIFSFNSLTSSSGKGGGEYLFAKDAWDNAEKSWQFFTTNYATNSKLSFGARSVSEIGSEFCKGELSLTYPDGFGSVLDATSPVQINAWFDESPYTDATVPPTSQYSVFYHIYAGRDAGARYQVYLKSPTGTAGYISKSEAVVATGYIAAGGRVSEKKDYLDASGYKELCVRIDTKDYCGYKMVSTSAALNYAQDKALEDQANNEVTTEKECISGSPSIGAFLTPNIQQGAESFVNPEIYNSGIIRVCANKNPGTGVSETRWKDVGYCDDSAMRCWIDEQSVQNAIKGRGVENMTLTEIDNLGVKNMLSQGYYSGDQVKTNISLLKEKYEGIRGHSKTSALTAEEKALLGELDKDVQAVYEKTIFSNQKAYLLFFKAMVYDAATNVMFSTGGGATVVPEKTGETATVAEEKTVAVTDNNPCKTEDTCLRCMAYAEASGSTDDGKIPVKCTQTIMSTIQNRVGNSEFVDSEDVCSIVSSSGQYSAYDCVNNPSADNQKYCDCCANPNTILKNVPSAPSTSSSLTEADSFVEHTVTIHGFFDSVASPSDCNFEGTSNPIFDFYKASS